MTSTPLTAAERDEFRRTCSWMGLALLAERDALAAQVAGFITTINESQQQRDALAAHLAEMEKELIALRGHK